MCDAWVSSSYYTTQTQLLLLIKPASLQLVLLQKKFRILYTSSTLKSRGLCKLLRGLLWKNIHTHLVWAFSFPEFGTLKNVFWLSNKRGKRHRAKWQIQLLRWIRNIYIYYIWISKLWKYYCKLAVWFLNRTLNNCIHQFIASMKDPLVINKGNGQKGANFSSNNSTLLINHNENIDKLWLAMMLSHANSQVLVSYPWKIRDKHVTPQRFQCDAKALVMCGKFSSKQTENQSLTARMIDKTFQNFSKCIKMLFKLCSKTFLKIC